MFANIAAGNALLDKAVIEGISSRVARSAVAWQIAVALDGGNRVTVKFNGTALQHIT